MKRVGRRHEATLAAQADGQLLKTGARFSEALAAMGTQTFIVKGLYRFKSQEAANQHQLECMARGLAARAIRAGRVRINAADV